MPEKESQRPLSLSGRHNFELLITGRLKISAAPQADPPALKCRELKSTEGIFVLVVVVAAGPLHPIPEFFFFPGRRRHFHSLSLISPQGGESGDGSLFRFESPMLLPAMATIAFGEGNFSGEKSCRRLALFFSTLFFLLLLLGDSSRCFERSREETACALESESR